MNQRTRLFRQHDAAPAVASTIYRQLTQDWAHLHSLPSTSATVRRWGRCEPALAGFERPGDVVDEIDRSDTERTNELLLALLRLFQNNQQLAGRTLLQAFMPKLAKIANSVPNTEVGTQDAEDSQAITIAEFWSVMATYPVERRTSRVASNLPLETLRIVTGQRREHAPIPIDPEVLSYSRSHRRAQAELPAAQILAEQEDAPDQVVDDALTPDDDLIDVIAWATRAGAITPDEAKLLVTVYLTDETPADWETTDGRRAPAVIRKRCSRAVRKLSAAVRAEMETPLLPLPDTAVAPAAA